MRGAVPDAEGTRPHTEQGAREKERRSGHEPSQAPPWGEVHPFGDAERERFEARVLLLVNHDFALAAVDRQRAERAVARGDRHRARHRGLLAFQALLGQPQPAQPIQSASARNTLHELSGA
jgi:hypothetical protein